MSDRKLTCVVADDHTSLRELLVRYLKESGVTVVGQAGDGEEALARIEASQPSVAVIDVRLPRLSGIEVVRRAVRSAPETSAILYTGFADRGLLVDALDAGARGFVSKEAPLDDLIRAIRTVAEGGTFVCPLLAALLVGAEATEKLPHLSKRQREVLRLLADGLTNAEIGRQLFLSPETVRTYVRSAMHNLDADTRTQAVATAIRLQLLA